MFTISRSKKTKTSPVLDLRLFPVFLPRKMTAIGGDNWKTEYNRYLNGLLVERNPHFMEVLTSAFNMGHIKGDLCICYKSNKDVELEFIKFFKSIYKPFCISLGIPLPKEEKDLELEFD